MFPCDSTFLTEPVIASKIGLVRRICGRVVLARKWKYLEWLDLLSSVAATKVRSVYGTALKAAAMRIADAPSGHPSRNRAFYARTLRQGIGSETRPGPILTHRFCGRAHNTLT